MNKMIFLSVVLGLLVSCGEQKGGKKRKIFFPHDERGQEQEFRGEEQRNIRIASLRAEKLEVNLQKEGVLDSRSLAKGRTRYLREKVLDHVFDNIYNQKEKQSLKINHIDELRFFPNKISFETKQIAAEAIKNSASKTGGWTFESKISWRGLSNKDTLTNVLLSLGSVDRKKKQLSHYGADLLKKESGLAHFFDNESGTTNVKLSFGDVPLSLMNSLVEPNTKMFFEIKNFNINGKGMKSFYQESRGDKTRVIISLPYGEKYYWIKKGEKLESLLREIDPSLELNFDHSILSLFGHTQDEVFAYPDRNILNDESIDNGLSFWWSNSDEDISKIVADGRTIVLSFFDLKELKNNQNIWTDYFFDFEDSFSLKDTGQKSIVGKIRKYSIEYQARVSEKQIPFEIGSKVCLEDNRFERKAVDCSIHWKPAFSYPIAHFRTQVVQPRSERSIQKNEISIRKEKELDQTSFGLIKVDQITSEVLELTKEPLVEIKGGFFGWKSYDPRLNGLMVRAPFDNLSTHQILKGFKNKYEFYGWKLEFPASH